MPKLKYSPQIPTRIKHILQDEGLFYAGIAAANHHPILQEQYHHWITDKKHGKMDYLARHAPQKVKPDSILTNCQSIITIGLNYYQEQPKNKLKVARYAWGRDYHKTISKKLKRICQILKAEFPNEKFLARTDATPLMERAYAQNAGLGFIGKNTMLITPNYGSWVLLGEIFTTKVLPTSPKTNKQLGVCGTCNRCQQACPTNALDTAYQIDATKCISYLTIEHKGSIPESLRPKIGGWLFGCDICQEVCPHNVRSQITTEPDFQKHIAGPTPELQQILDCKTDEDFVSLFAGSPFMRAKRVGLIRNACVVIGNLKLKQYLPKLQELSQDKNSIISEHASWAIKEIAKA